MIKICILTDDSYEIMGGFSLFSDAAALKSKLEQSHSPQGPLPPYHIVELELDIRKNDKVRPFWKGSICVHDGAICEMSKYIEVTNFLGDFTVHHSPKNIFIIVKSYMSENHCKYLLQKEREKVLTERGTLV